MRIGTTYSQTASVTAHAEGAYAYVTFPAWTALTRGSNAVACSTELAMMQPGERQETGSVTVNAHNVGC